MFLTSLSLSLSLSPPSSLSKSNEKMSSDTDFKKPSMRGLKTKQNNEDIIKRREMKEMVPERNHFAPNSLQPQPHLYELRSLTNQKSASKSGGDQSLGQVIRDDSHVSLGSELVSSGSCTKVP